MDPDIILYLCPSKSEGFEGAVTATEMPKNKSRFLAAGHADAPKSQETEILENTGCLVLRFSQGARTGVGVVGGYAADADLAFPKGQGISEVHLAFTFDDKCRPIVRDLGSSGGTRVTYGGEEGERLSNFTWLLQGPSILSGKPSVLNISDNVQFKVVVPHHDITSPDYVARVKKFQSGTADPNDLFASVVLSNEEDTRLPTKQQMPLTSSDSRRIFYQEKLGSGSFGVVRYIWDATTGEEYVEKMPLPKLIETNRVDIKCWENEAEIMGSISHKHIVAFRGATFSPWPKLEFEYVSGGSLEAYKNLSTLENTQIACQLSSALESLHNRQPSIAHRDIKPENILVVKREKKGIEVKFADFGLSKEADAMSTICGTLPWMAPEIYLKAADIKGTANDTYSVAIDIWSLGVVIAKLECDMFPECQREWASDSMAWIHIVLSHVNCHFQQSKSELLRFLLDNMLVEDPDKRSSAGSCHKEAQKLLQRITNTPRQVPGDDDDDSTTPKPSMLVAQSAVKSNSTDPEASTLRQNIQSASSDGSETPTRETPISKTLKETPTRETVKSTSSSLIADPGYRDDSLIDSLVNLTESEEWQQSGVPSPDAQPSQVPATSAALPQDSMVDGSLWNSEPANPTSSHDGEATGLCTGEAQINDQPKEQDGLSSLICNSLCPEVSGVGAGELNQSTRKRTRSVDKSPSPPADTSNRDNKEPPGSPDHKRSKTGG